MRGHLRTHDSESRAWETGTILKVHVLIIFAYNSKLRQFPRDDAQPPCESSFADHGAKTGGILSCICASKRSSTADCVSRSGFLDHRTTLPSPTQMQWIREERHPFCFYCSIWGDAARYIERPQWNNEFYWVPRYEDDYNQTRPRQAYWTKHDDGYITPRTDRPR